MSNDAIDMAAASRVSRRVDLREIRLTDIKATCDSLSSGSRTLTPTYDHTCVPVDADEGFIRVACSYHFKVKSSEVELADASLTYHILYKLNGEEPAEPTDIEQFAKANGAYHSWPFVRETLFSLTSRMGFPPYTLPVLSFFPPKPKPKPPQTPEAEPASQP